MENLQSSIVILVIDFSMAYAIILNKEFKNEATISGATAGIYKSCYRKGLGLI
ncbi:hypothetical protein G6M14_08810 [Agrobacterium tumefaciens]|uniref:hypothetical protein n=1 Tax=Agrobacterium tumefaciens TaxID=358 RepID=UPI00157186A5|nr:hypothetical protein [Agrobacterium tumefaciens]